MNKHPAELPAMQAPTARPKRRAATKTARIIIEQAALEPWPQLDLTDGALLNHVLVRLTRRTNQKTIMHQGQPCVWVHYPTVQAENWMIKLAQRGLEVRFRKLAELGLLVRTTYRFGGSRGSATFYGIGPELKARLEQQDRVPAGRVNQHSGVGLTFEPHPDVGSFEPHPGVGQSLGLSPGEGGERPAAPPLSPTQEDRKYLVELNRIRKLSAAEEKQALELARQVKPGKVISAWAAYSKRPEKAGKPFRFFLEDVPRSKIVKYDFARGWEPPVPQCPVCGSRMVGALCPNLRCPSLEQTPEEVAAIKAVFAKTKEALRRKQAVKVAA